MRFNKRKHSGASTLITAMLVVIVALAGTAVYAVVSSNATHDGYAMPGSPTVLGYSDDYILSSSMIGEGYAMAWRIADELKDKSSTGIKIDVPGLGKTDGRYYDVTIDGIKAKVTTILHGMVYSFESSESSMKLVSGDFKL